MRKSHAARHVRHGFRHRLIRTVIPRLYHAAGGISLNAAMPDRGKNIGAPASVHDMAPQWLVNADTSAV